MENRTMDDPNATDSLVQETSGDSEGEASELEALRAERDQLLAERAELHERLLRRAAEFDNYRKRVERERTESSQYAGMDAARAVLPVLDDLERALRHAPAEDEFVRGMEMIRNRLAEALKKMGAEPIEAVGQPFDPNMHHAVEMVQTEEAEDSTVLEEFQRGYTFRGRLLRPALVKVAAQP